MADHIDPEKGLISPVARSIISPATSSMPLNAKQSSSNQTSLELFQDLVGLRTPSSLDHHDAKRTPSHPKKQLESKNIGLYQRCRNEERQSRLAYLSTSIISNTLYMLQILLAATFTALSAYKDSNPVTLTVLGAVNTVVAGYVTAIFWLNNPPWLIFSSSLAWQKGQGVPQRYRKAQDAYQALILEIEMAERAFVDVDHGVDANNGAKLDPHTEKARLFKLFETAKADQQANYPDLYVSTGAAAAKGGQDIAKQMEDAKTAAAQQLDDAKADAAKLSGELLAKIEESVGKLENRIGAQVQSAIQGALKKVGT